MIFGYFGEIQKSSSLHSIALQAQYKILESLEMSQNLKHQK